MRRKQLKIALGKVGSASAAAKCAAATQHDSNKFSIQEEKPYAEVRDNCLIFSCFYLAKACIAMDGNASFSPFQGSQHPTKFT